MSDTADTIATAQPSLPEPVLDATSNGTDAADGRSLMLDAEAPRLAAAPLAAPTPAAPAATPLATPTDGGRPDLPLVSPVLASMEVPVLPDAPDLPVATPDDESPVAETADDESAHPMAHLMPQKVAPTEASMRAAEQRAAKKARARKIKIGVGAGALVVAAIAGPPLAGWLTDAINEAGSTSTETPAD